MLAINETPLEKKANFEEPMELSDPISNIVPNETETKPLVEKEVQLQITESGEMRISEIDSRQEVMIDSRPINHSISSIIADTPNHKPSTPPPPQQPIAKNLPTVQANQGIKQRIKLTPMLKRPSKDDTKSNISEKKPCLESPISNIAPTLPNNVAPLKSNESCTNVPRNVDKNSNEQHPKIEQLVQKPVEVKTVENGREIEKAKDAVTPTQKTSEKAEKNEGTSLATAEKPVSDRGEVEGVALPATDSMKNKHKPIR